MREDNIYTRSTAHLRQIPSEQSDEHAEEEIQVRNEYPIISQAVERFERRADESASTRYITQKWNPLKFMIEVWVNKRVEHEFRAEAEYLNSLLDEHVRSGR